MSNKAITQALMKSFHKWGQTGRHSITYKNANKKSFKILEDYLLAPTTVKPSCADFDVWYVRNHMKYGKRIAGSKAILQDDIRRVYELTYKFFEARRKAQHATAVRASEKDSGPSEARV